METLASLIESFFDRPENSFRTYGGMFIAVVVAVLAYFTAREQARKWRQLKGGHQVQLASGPLTATAIKTESYGEVPYTATITSDDDGLRVVVIKGPEPDTTVVFEHAARSLSEMEQLLRKHTQFILSDFS